MSKIPAKVCIIHGTEDEVVPFWHGEKMFSLLQNPARPLFIKNGGHNNLETDFEELLFNRLEQFFNSL